MRKYNTTDEIREAFIKKGWQEDTTYFRERYQDGKKLYEMCITGDLYDEYGMIYQYNIPCCAKEVTEDELIAEYKRRGEL